uniref:Uncharacterized protein n=1 Tax=viral metagenome TaxID=1070528 RepID=A0A6C0CQP9_9ZZZZ
MARSLTGGKRRRRSRTRKSRKPRRKSRKSRKSRKPRRKSRKSRKRSKTRRRRRTKQQGGSTLGFGMPGSSGNHGQLAPYSIGNRYFGSSAPYTHGK